MLSSQTTLHSRFFMVGGFFGNVVVTSHMIISTAGFGSNYYLDLLRVTTITGNFFFFFYDMLHSFTLRPCCEVLIAYVRHQHATIRAVLPTENRPITGPMGISGVAELQRVKSNLRCIAKLRELLNDIWQYSLAISSAAVLIIGCICVYCTFDSGMPLNQILLTLSYFVYSALDFIDVARLSDAMASEVSVCQLKWPHTAIIFLCCIYPILLSLKVRALRDTLATASMHRSSATELREVAHLYISICPEDMSLSGGSFFSLDLPLLVSIGGSIITYSVILVQTSDDVEHLQVAHTNHS
ncbi:uncharacterized protein LOC142563092 isoform X1 [Dermacentor variabilis]|uniref:uncharacterized protein LOC142563092 isoform X1 n=1 Tax=Dermacentor variabilis TaxID=34621 RepID=UPI003F5C301F